MADRPSPPQESRRPRLLFYAMYDPSAQDSAPKVRIRLLAEALTRQAEVTFIAGDRLSRLRPLLRWIRQGGMGAVDGIYVETSTSTVLPHDLLLFAWARWRRRPLGIYFRDAHQLFRRTFPVTTNRQRLADVVWRFTMPIARRLATVRFVPTVGLGRVLGITTPTLLPPGTDPSMPFLGAGHGEPLVAAIATPAPAGDIPLVLGAMSLVHDQRPAVRLRLIGRIERSAEWPAWIEVIRADRGELAEVLRPASVCVIPLRRTPYSDLAVPVRLTDLLALGKPIVATATSGSRALVGDSGAVVFAPDTPDDLAREIIRLIDEPARADVLAGRARAAAASPEMTWDSRARVILRSLGLS